MPRISRFRHRSSCVHKLGSFVLFTLARNENHCKSYGARNQTQVRPMAEHHAQSAGHSAMDYEEHEKTYRLFIKLIKYTMGSAVLLLIFLAFFLT